MKTLRFFGADYPIGTMINWGESGEIKRGVVTMDGVVEKTGRWDAWRDVDNTRRRVGIIFWWIGCEVNLGRRCYRIRRWIGD